MLRKVREANRIYEMLLAEEVLITRKLGAVVLLEAGRLIDVEDAEPANRWAPAPRSPWRERRAA